MKNNLSLFKDNVFGFINKLIGGGKYAPGHFYSPAPSRNDYFGIKPEWQNFPLITPLSLPGIDLRLKNQVALIHKFGQSLQLLSFPSEALNGRHYYSNNVYFGLGDALVLSGFIAKLKPSKIIEIGSGFSTAVMVDAAKYFCLDINISCIEPYPDRLELLGLLDSNSVTLLKEKVQDIDLNIFKDLDENDILFIDSSHVSKFGSDVNHLIFNILPILKKGVVIHFHDIHFPFTYEQSFLERGFFWNESYILRAFLQFNEQFEIKWFSHYLTIYCADELQKCIPAYLQNGGGSIWLERV
jgi:hypothetical protein